MMMPQIVGRQPLLLPFRWASAARRGVASGTLDHVPGPAPSDPLLGNLGDVGRAGSLHQYLQQLSELHGPVASFSWGTRRVVSLSHPRAFLDAGKLHDRPQELFAAFKPLIGEHSIQYANGPAGKERHKLMTRAFDKAAMGAYFGELSAVFSSAAEDWAARLGCGPALEVSASQEGMIFGLRGIMCAAFSETSPEELRVIRDSYHVCWDEMEAQLSGAVLEKGSEREKAFEDSLSNLHRFVAKQVAGPERLLSMMKGRSDLYPTDASLADEAVTAMVGGFHTTGTLLTWLFYFLARHPEIQDRLAAECEEVSAAPSVSAVLSQGTLLSRVIRETLRARAIAPWAARTVGDEEVVAGGHPLPPGTAVVLALGVVQQDPQIWPDPSLWDPARFEEDAVKARRKEWGPLVFAPFGFAGQRVCPGSQLTMVEASLCLAAILPRFRLELASNKDPGVVYGLVTHPRDDVRIVVKART